MVGECVEGSQGDYPGIPAETEVAVRQEGGQSTLFGGCTGNGLHAERRQGQGAEVSPSLPWTIPYCGGEVKHTASPTGGCTYSYPNPGEHG